MDESNASLRNMSPEKMRDCAILALWYGKPDTSLDALSDIVRALTGASEDELRGELSHIARALKGATEEDILEMRRYGDQMEMRELITEHNQPFKPRLIGYLYCFATQSHEPVSVDVLLPRSLRFFGHQHNPANEQLEPVMVNAAYKP